MNIDKLTQRVTEKEAGKTEVSIAQVKEIVNCLQHQLMTDTNGNFDLYGILHSIAEPPE